MTNDTHVAKRRSLTTASLALLLLGAPLMAYGIWRFGQNFFMPTAEFFANPTAVMDVQKQNGFIGLCCFGAGSVLLALGLKGVVFSRLGSILHFTATEAAPALDVLAGAKEIVKVRCRHCRSLSPEGERFCSSCNRLL